MFSTVKTLHLLFNNHDKRLQTEMNKDIITKLKFISTFEIGQKMDSNNFKIESNNIMTPIKRFIYGDSRDNTIKFLNNTIDRSFEIIQCYSNSDRKSEIILCSNIINDLNKSIQGLNNIKETYKEDKLFTCSIDILIELIDARLTELREKNPDLFTSLIQQNEVINESKITNKEEILKTSSEDKKTQSTYKDKHKNNS
jgi:hypothetical protein